MNKRSNMVRATVLAVGALLAGGGCSMSQAPAAQIDDAGLHARVGSRLTMDPDVRRYDIDVDVLDRVVTLRGIVDDEAARMEAERVARETTGVKEVRNLLMLESEVPESERSDIVMRVKIGTQLAADPDVRRVDIDIDVDEGLVTLSGVVADQRARDEAVRIARSVEGVRDVRDELKIAEVMDADEAGPDAKEAAPVTERAEPAPPAEPEPEPEPESGIEVEPEGDVDVEPDRG